MTEINRSYNNEPHSTDGNPRNESQRKEEYLGTTLCAYIKAEDGLRKCKYEETNGTDPDCGGHCRDFGGEKFCEGRLKKVKKLITDSYNKKGLEEKI